MGIAREASAEIDRLILGVNRRVGPKHADRLRAMANDIGLEDLGLLPSFAGFLLDGLLTREIAQLRMRYRPAEEVTEWLRDLEQRRLVEVTAGKLRATDTMRPLLKAMESAVADVAFDLWAGHEVAVSVATEAAHSLREAITSEHVVARAHCDVREPIDRYKMLEQRLVTLRCIRQHDHAAAWIDRGFTAREMRVITPLWRGEPVEIDDELLAELRESHHLKKGDPPELTQKARRERDAVEDDTNQRSEKIYEVLGTDAGARFLDSLRRLPA